MLLEVGLDVLSWHFHVLALGININFPKRFTVGANTALYRVREATTE